MPIVFSVGILRRPPTDSTSLGRNHDNLGTLLQDATVDQRGRNTHRTQSANINHFQFLRKVERIQPFHGLVKVTCIVNELSEKNEVQL
jgi:hypothetical protein